MKIFILICTVSFIITAPVYGEDSVNNPSQWISIENIIETAMNFAHKDPETKIDLQFLPLILSYPVVYVAKDNNYTVSFEYYSVSEDILFVKEVVVDKHGNAINMRSQQRFITGRFAQEKDKDQNAIFRPVLRDTTRMKRWQ